MPRCKPITVSKCEECPFYYDDYCYCSLQKDVSTWDEDKLFKECPLKQHAIIVELKT